ncbi:MAG TPA: PLP-dependent aminotransferase family protein [Pseudorhodoferax sp.]|nr:PLP-dependent aminotransferase family protein [Pseudorhodoferax sp.]
MSLSALSDYLLQHLDRDNATVPLNRQIYDVMRQAILHGDWAAGVRLPSSRQLADDVGLARNTVLHAYQQLLAEGYISTRSGSGTFVSDTLPDQLPARSRASAQQPANLGEGISRRGQRVVLDAGISNSPSGAFALGVSDTSAFPQATWARLIGRRWRYSPPELLKYAHDGGYLPLRQALADHLRLARSVNCTPEQIVITTSIQQSIGLIAQMLADVGDQVWVEEPGYRAARNLLRASGLQPVPIAVDEEGLAPQTEEMREAPRLIYVTPSHQFPLGMVMSLARRRMLLEYAHQRNAWILEDDYDSEFRFEGRRLASLQGWTSTAAWSTWARSPSRCSRGCARAMWCCRRPSCATARPALPSCTATAS